MKRRFTILTAALALLAFLALPMGMWGQSTKTERFETATASSTYNGTVNISTNQSDCGIGWTIYYGTVSTQTPIAGSKSAQMRWYKSALSNYPYLKSTTAIEGLTNVAFKARVGNTDVKMDVHYSSDGENWTALATAVAFSNTNAADFSYDIPSGGKYIKFGVSSSSTAPNGTFYSLLVDNVVFTYSSSVNTYTVTYHANVIGTTDIEVEYNEGDDVTVASNTFVNPGYTFTEWNTESDGLGDSYAPGDVIEDIDDNLDLYAQWEESASTTGNIKFGSSTGHVKINAQSVSGDDDLGNEWTITTEGTTSFTQQATYSQVGSGSNPATSITFTTTLPEEVDVTAMEVKFGGFNGTAGTITMKVENTTIGTGSLNGTADVVVNSTSAATGTELTVTVTGISKGVKAYYISYTYEASGSAVATTTTISAPANFNTDIYTSTTAGTLTATVNAEGTPINGASVTWSSSNTGVAAIDANGAVTLVAVGTTTITASYAGIEGQYRPSIGTYDLTVTSSEPIPGTENNPYTVAQAIANTPSSGNVYIQGIVSSFYNTSIVGDGSNYRYYISDDGTTTTQLLVYKGKGLNQATFTNANDLLVGDEVVIYGTLVTYQNAPEVASGNYLYSWNRPVAAVEAPTFSPAAGTYAEAQNVTISCATTGADIYYTLDGTEPDANSTPYSGTISVTTTTTIKAIAYYAGANSTVATATYHINSQTNPYTVTQALAFNEYPANGIYVSGIVSTAPTSLSNGMLTYYISVDGNATNQLEVYKGKDMGNENFTAVDDIQVGDIVTIYGNVVIYNNTKEFAQGNYLVSFERPAQEYTLTVTCSENVEIFTFVGDSTDPAVEGPTTQQVTSGTEVGISVSATTGYILTLMVDGTDVTSQLDETGYYTFYMPTHNVTVTATASAAPVVTTNTYTLATSIESGKQYIIVGQADGDYYAMGENKGNNRNAYEITLNGTTATATVASGANVHEFTITSLATPGYYSICDAIEPGYLYAGSSNGNQLKTETELDSNHNGDWEIIINAETGVASVVASLSNNRNVMQFNNTAILFNCYSGASQHPVYLYVKDEISATQEFTLEITPYLGNKDHYYLIASPVQEDITPSVANGFITNEYDLYMFDQTGDEEGKEWINFEPNGAFDLVNGMGYLYASSTRTTLTFTGTPVEGPTASVSLVLDDEAEFPGWNLVGNPFAGPATIGDRDFYTINGETNELMQNSGEIAKMNGVFVIAEENDEELVFTAVSGTGTGQAGEDKLVLNLSKGNSLIDRAVVRFGEGRQLPKFQLFKNSTKLYITEGNQDFAVVRSNNEGEMLVSFKAAENGSYTLSVNAENVEMNYLHLIDNMTGADIDLLSTPNYTFEAKTTDYASRFKLVFATGDNSDSFAFFSNGNLVINNEGNATLQVVDVTGRIVRNETINGNASIDMNTANGVYMLRLVNGENVKVQKVVVR